MIDKGVDYEFIKKQENPGLRHGIRHKSPEGGTDTIGYGHKLTPEESKSGEVYGIKIKDMTPEDAEVVLRKDVQRHAAKAAKKFEEKYDESWDDLSDAQRHLFVDYEYNLGSWQKFPKFFDAVVNEDVPGMVSQYKRMYTTPDGETKEIEARNKATHMHILENFAVEKPEQPQRQQWTDSPTVPTAPPAKQPTMNGMLDTGMPASPQQAAPLGQQPGAGMLMTPRGDVVNPIDPQPMPKTFSF
jgi:GH24 family phage-related lysozyme (muramidase)